MRTIKIKDWWELPDKFTGIVEHTNGDKVWYKDGNLHRIGGPAIEWANGDKCWYKDDKLHRIDGPAVEHANGNKSWYIEDKQYSYEEWLEETAFYRTLVGELFLKRSE